MQWGKLIGEAYRIALHNRRLWPFGLFAGTTFGFNLNFNFGGDDGESLDPNGNSIDPDPDLIIGIVLIVLVVAALAAVMAVISQGALARSVAAISRGEQRGFRQALRAGTSAFWPMLGLVVLAFALALALLLVVAIPLGGVVLGTFAVTDSTGVRVAVAVLAVLIAIPVLLAGFFALILIDQHAIRSLALDGTGPVDSLRGGWRLLRTNVGPSILLLLIQQGIAIGASIVVGIAALLLCLPAIITLIATSVGTAGIVVAAITALVVLPAVLAAIGAIGTFSHGLWTLGYLRMTAAPDGAPT